MTHDLSLAQDPNELFDVVLADGTPTGITKRRADVHRDGDWHRAVHVWVTGNIDSAPFLIFQRRSMAKDTSPGKLDPTVGGHYRAGEGLEQTIREVEEEIGIRVSLADLTYAGRRTAVNEGTPGIVDRELQDVFFLRDERALGEFNPNPAEVAGLLRVPLVELMEFLVGGHEQIPAVYRPTGGDAEVAISLTRNDLSLRGDRYVYRVAIAARSFLNGERHFSV